MTISTVLLIWQAMKEQFHKTVKALPEQDLSFQMGSQSIGSMLHHNAESRLIRHYISLVILI